MYYDDWKVHYSLIHYSSVKGNEPLQIPGERSKKNNLVMVVDDFNARLDKILLS